MPIHESGENYLEQILILSRRLPKVRAVDIGAALGFSRPTVSVMLRELRAEGFVAVGEDGGLALTERGRAVADRIYERHCLLIEVLTGIGVSPKTAREEACRIEHDISDETFDCIKAHRDRVREASK